MTSALFKFFLVVGSEWVLWVLAACSLLTVTVILERWKFLRNQNEIGQKLWKTQLENWVKEGVPEDWKALSSTFAKKYPCVESRLLILLANTKFGVALDKVAYHYLLTEKISLEKFLAVLGTLGNAAPFIGLFGTVLGIVHAFSELGKGGESAGLQSISGGLAEALVTTATGLIVAIPASLAYNFYQRKVKLIQIRCTSIAGILNENNSKKNQE
jgi:biopolymer transport protein ExbB